MVDCLCSLSINSFLMDFYKNITICQSNDVKLNVDDVLTQGKWRLH